MPIHRVSRSRSRHDMRGGAHFSTGTRVTVVFNEGQSIFHGTHQGVFTIAGNDESGETTWGQIKFDDTSSYPGLYFNYNAAHNWYTVTPTRTQPSDSAARQESARQVSIGYDFNAPIDPDHLPVDMRQVIQRTGAQQRDRQRQVGRSAAYVPPTTEDESEEYDIYHI